MTLKQVGIASTGISKVVDGQSQYIFWRFSANSNGIPMTDKPTDDTRYMGVYTSNRNKPSENPAEYIWTQIKGNDGANGESSYSGVLTDDLIAVNTDSSGANGDYSNASTSIILFKGTTENTDQWTIIVTATEGIQGEQTSAKDTYKVSNLTTDSGEITFTATLGNITITKIAKIVKVKQGIKGDKGDSGKDGIAGKDGVGLKSTSIHYATSKDGIRHPEDGWSEQVPAVPGGDFLWTRTTWTYTDNTSETGYSVAKMGMDGAKGDDGIAGKDGVGIKNTKIEYAVGDNGITAPSTGWSVTIPTTPNGQYLWTKTTWTYTDDTTEVGFTVAKQGEKGDKGIPGDKGADGRTQYTHIAYADDPAGKGFSQSPENKSYIGMYVDFTEQDSNDPKAYAWSLIKGADGKDGIAGKPGADGKTPYFHTAYINSIDFEKYDFSGNLNIAPNITNTIRTLNVAACKVTNSTDYVTVTQIADGTSDAGIALALGYNLSGFGIFPVLKSNAKYTFTVPIRINSSYTGDSSKLYIRFRGKDKNNATLVGGTYNLPANAKKDVFTDYKFTITMPETANTSSWFLMIGAANDISARGSIDVKYNIKLEEGETATPYQPNLLDRPYYFSKISTDHNLINDANSIITNNSYLVNTYNLKQPLNQGEMYTLTLKGSKPNSQTWRPFFTIQGEAPWSPLDLEPLEDQSGVWSKTFTMSKPSHNTLPQVLIYQVPNTSVGQCTIDWIKLEKSNTPNIDSHKYIGTYTDFIQSDSDNPTLYHWNQARGEDGVIAKTFLLNASNNIVKRNQQGTPINETIKFTVQMQNMVGVATFSAVPYINDIPQTAITLGGTGNTRTFSTSSWNASWTSLVVKATFDKFDDTQTLISIQEGRNGIDAITGLLTNESVTLSVSGAGEITNLDDAKGIFKVFDGLSDVTGKNVVYAIKSSSNGTFELNPTTGAYSVKTITGKSAQAIFTATYKSIVIEKTLSVTKVQDGQTSYVDTLYSNSIDFGNYDYSGNPNIMSIIKAADFTKDGDVTISDVGYNSIRLTSQGDNRLSVWASNNMPSLVNGKTYTISAKVKIESGTTGNVDKLRVSYRKINGGAILLSAIATGVEVGKEITIKSTAVVNYEITDLLRFYLTIDTADSDKIKGSVIVSDIKIEEGSKATPYQPNLLEEPFYLSKTSINNNLADPTITFPIKTSAYRIYGVNMLEDFKIGQEYTLTMKATKPSSQQFKAHNGGNVPLGVLLPVEGLADVWSCTFTPTTIESSSPRLLSIYQMPQSTVGECTIDWLKIEKGSVRTPNIESYKYMGMYIGTTQAPVSNPTQYAWSQIRGEDITTYSLDLSSQVMSLLKGTNTLVPANVVIKGMSTTGNHPGENITSRITVEETVDGTTWTTKHDADVTTYTYTPTSTNVISARVKMFMVGGKTNQLDQKSIAIVKDGSNGSNGSSTYTWIRYSENATGNPMTTMPNDKTKYIGIAMTTTNTAPTEFSKYTWSRIKGSGGLVAKVYSNGGTTIHSSPIQINVETQSDGDIVEPSKVTWYYSKDSSTGWQALITNSDVKVETKSITVQPSFFLGASAISFKAQVEYQSMAAFDTISVNNESFDATRPLILRQPTAPTNPYPGLLWLDTSSGSGKPLDKTNPSLVYRWGKTVTETIDGSEYLHYAYANSPTGDTDFSTTYNNSSRPQYIGVCVTDTEADPTTATSYNWKSITNEDGSEDKNGDKGIAQDKIVISEQWGWIVLNAEDLKMLPWLNNEDGSTIIDWIYQITNKTSDNSIVQTVVGSEDMSKVYAKAENVNELADANNELASKLEEYNQQMQSAFAGLDANYINKSEFEQEMTKFNFGIDKAGGVNLIRNSTGFQWDDYTPGAEILKNPKFEGNPLTIWNYNVSDIGQVLPSEPDMSGYNILRIGNSTNTNKWSCSEHVSVTPGSLINISGQSRFPNTIGSTRHLYVSVRFYAAGVDPTVSSVEQTINNGQGYINLYTDQTFSTGTSLNELVNVKSNGSAKDVWNNYSMNIHVPEGAATMRLCLVNSSSEATTYFDFRCPSIITYTGMFDFWHKSKQTNASIRQILGDESLEELGLIAGFELKGHTYFLDQNILLPHANTEYTLSWYAKKTNITGTSKYFVKIYDLKTNKELASSDSTVNTTGYQRMSVTFTAADSKELFIRIGLEGAAGDANATLTAAGLMVNIGPYPLSWQSHHEEVYSTNVRIDSSGLKVFNSDYDGYNVMTPKEFAGYYRNGGAYEQVFTLNKDTTKVKKLEAQERFMMSPLQIVSVNSDNIQGWAFVSYNGEDTD